MKFLRKLIDIVLILLVIENLSWGQVKSELGELSWV